MLFQTQMIDSILHLSVSHMILNETQDFDLKNYTNKVNNLKQFKGTLHPWLHILNMPHALYFMCPQSCE